ncbi:cyclic di-AMP binding protein CbpA [Metabacillus malikii]|uniref:CBS domain-containing protein n=1 Tax=Metabacillus malikii TaxID=1504265 RepID=A0ABT9ZB75_9BACI|nr:cyclic di-AMP binding protein CbpA [Metabacillus malikii]MDQ0229472.1 CBS domain-containing protein [Metabacillus malikii]
MKVRYHFVKKKDVKYCDSQFTVKQAYDFLNTTGYRSVPVLENDGTKFIGLIYKVHLLEHYFENKGQDNDSIKPLITNHDAFIYENDSFFKTFISIRRLPFLAVLNDKQEFSGIITHANVMDVLEDSFGMRTGGYVLTIGTKEHKGALKDLVTAVKDVNIEGLLTLDNGDKYLRRIILNISSDVTESKLAQIVEKLESREFRVAAIEKIDHLVKE